MADEPFVWGSGGGRLTPEEIAQRRKDATLLVQQGTDASPLPTGTRGAGVWTQGLSRVAKALSGGLEAREADQAAKANADENRQTIAALLGQSGAPAAATTAAPVAAPVTAAAAPAAAPAGLDPETTGYINAAADKHGVPADYLSRTAMIESGGKIDAVNPKSGASGLYQFMPKTAKEYGLDNPLDPEDSAMAAAELAKDNRDALRTSLGRNPTNAELYLAHQQGATGAAKLLANPDAPAVSVIGRDAVLANGGQEGMTAGQFAQKWLGKYGPDAPVVAQGGTPLPAAIPAAVAKVAAAADDSAAIPANATPTQGVLPVEKVAQALPVAAPAASATQPNPNVAKVQAAMQAFTSPYSDPATKQVAGMVLQQAMKPQVGAPYKDPDLGVVQKAADGTVHVLSATDKDPKWGIVGKDQYGQPTYGYAPTREEYAAAQKAKSAQPASDQPDLTNVHGKEYLDTLVKQDPKYASQIQAIIEGRAPYPSGMLLNRPYGQKLAQDVTQTDPTFEAGNSNARVKVRNEFEAGGVSSPAGQITAGNTAIQHAGEMSDALERMKADEGVLNKIGESGVPFVSKWANELHNAAVQGTPSGKSLNDFMTAKNHFSEEVTKFYAGSSGSEAERTRALANLDAAKSLPELRSAIKTEANLMQGKVNALQQRWRTGMGPLVPDFALIHPESQAAIDRVSQRDASSTAPPAQVATAAPSAVPPAAIAKLAQSPTPEMKAHFDEVFGAGAADRVLASGK